MHPRVLRLDQAFAKGRVFVKLRDGECRRAASKFTLLLSIEAVSPRGGCVELANPNLRDRNAVCCWSAVLLTRNTISMPAFWFVEIRLYHEVEVILVDSKLCRTTLTE